MIKGTSLDDWHQLKSTVHMVMTKLTKYVLPNKHYKNIILEFNRLKLSFVWKHTEKNLKDATLLTIVIFFHFK